MWQRLFVLRRSVMMTCFCLDDNGCPPSALQSSTPSILTFDPVIHLSVDPCVDLSAGLVLVGGAYCVPQVPVPQTCGPQRDQITSTCPVSTAHLQHVVTNCQQPWVPQPPAEDPRCQCNSATRCAVDSQHV